MIRNYTIEQLNTRAGRWEIVDYGRTLDEAIDKAIGRIGVPDYGSVAILDLQGFILMDSNGFRQGEGLRWPPIDSMIPETRIKNTDLERQQQETEYPDAPDVAPDGSC